MIAYLRGRVITKHPNQAIVDVNGVGYDVAISTATYSALPDTGAEASLHIHTHVREDALALFGFARPTEKQLFEKLIGISGIGPKLAITVLSGMTAEDLARAIRANDLTKLTKIPGVGKKTAERMCVELRDKLEGFGAAAAPGAAMTPLEEDVLSALTNLGYQRVAAEKVLATIKPAADAKFDSVFRQALAAMSR